MKNKLFCFKVYIEGIKQLKLIGIMAVIIFSIEAIIIGIGEAISQGFFYGYYGMENTYTVRMMELIDVHPILLLSFCVLAPLLTLYLFSFLNKRNSSDFYHSAPVSRNCLFVNYLGAILTWIAVVLIFSSLIAYITSLFFGNSYYIDIPSVFSLLFNMFAANVLVSAAIALAMSITGTIFSNIIVSLLIIFFPRLISTFFVGMISNTLPILIYNNFMPVLDVKYNVVCGFIFNIFIGNYDMLESFRNVYAGVYTLIIGLIFAFIALILFKKRKSETASKSAPSRLLQTIYHVVIATIVSLVPIFLIFDPIVTGSAIRGDIILIIIAMYILAIILTMIFELITSKKFKNLLKVFPSLLIIAIVNILFILCLLGTNKIILDTSPEADEIDYVTFIEVPNYNDYTYYDYTENRYFAKEISKLEITNPEIIDFIAKSLDENIDDFKNDVEYDYSTSKTVYININHGILNSKRKISLSNSQMNELLNILTEEKDFKNIFSSLPEYDDLDHFFLNNVNTDSENEDIKNIYDTFKEEIKSLSPYEWLYLDYDYIASNSIYFEYDGKYENIAIGSKTPKTYKALYDYYKNRNSENLDIAENIISNFSEYDWIEGVKISTINNEIQSTYSLSMSGSELNNLGSDFINNVQKFGEILNNSKENEFDIDSLAVKVDFMHFNDQETTTEQYSMLFFIDDQEDADFIIDTLNGYVQNTDYFYKY